MKIFFLPTSYPDENHPHTDIFIYEQAKQLAKQGNDVVILHILKLPTKKIFCRVDNNIQDHDDGFAKRFTIYQKTFFEGKFPNLTRDSFVSSAEKLYDYATKKCGKPDIIYAHFSCWAGYAGAHLATKYHIPLVTIEHHSGLMQDNILKSRREALSVSVEKSDVFLCVSPGLKRAVERHIQPNKELFVVSNMIDSSFIYHDRVDKDKFTFLAIGNINERKDFKTLINAFMAAFPKDAPIELRIGGDGPEKEKMISLVKEKSREHQILFLGSLTRQETIKEYINCDVFALASQFETFGLVYREAMAIGRPIVTTDHGGFSKENWKDSYGFMVQKRNENEFAKALISIFESYSNYDLKQISEDCLSQCSANSIGKQIEYYLFLACNKH